RRLLTTALAVLVLAGLLTAADWQWVLSTSARAGGLLVIAIAACALLGFGWLTAARKFGRREAAVEVEAAFPHLGHRVRTTLDYPGPDAAPTPAAPQLVRALAADTEGRTHLLDFGRLVPWHSLRWVAAGLAALVTLFVVLLVISPEARIAAQRL